MSSLHEHATKEINDTHHTGVDDSLCDSLASLAVGCRHVTVEPSHVKRNHADYGEPQQQNVTGLPVLKDTIKPVKSHRLVTNPT